ncbi:21.7 kDa class VI heat shock protein isoform X3 [Olea europaea var. sylvestris]|uniref:21.7 kDa class VI heat shock protein isoform X3 n=1 Tax=Olea europaea var. sylvestris TaxID=158386 RepID=UPI000C1D7F18|nr:21.7 kDa class VI heat shock protein isoform X3 [Olea europaea var. sylvestris]
MTSCRQLEIQFEDQNPQKWCHPLKEEAFAAIMGKENPPVHKVFDERSLFSPLLFGKFFDPSDAFPLWEFDSDELLPNLNSSGQRSVVWFQTDADCVLKADLSAPRGESKWEAQEPVLAYLINSGEINQETAELMWINCRLEMMQAEQALENLEVCISEEWPMDKERSSSAKADISKTVNILHPQAKFF